MSDSSRSVHQHVGCPVDSFEVSKPRNEVLGIHIQRHEYADEHWAEQSPMREKVQCKFNMGNSTIFIGSLRRNGDDWELGFSKKICGLRANGFDVDCAPGTVERLACGKRGQQRRRGAGPFQPLKMSGASCSSKTAR
jgi:hypothetical protein